MPALTEQNLTAHALRMKGVPETDIAAAIGNPERMKQLIYQTFGAGSANAPATPTICGRAVRRLNRWCSRRSSTARAIGSPQACRAGRKRRAEIHSRQHPAVFEACRHSIWTMKATKIPRPINQLIPGRRAGLTFCSKVCASYAS
jgi:hypothetical protein